MIVQLLPEALMPTTCDYIEDNTVEPRLVEVVWSMFHKAFDLRPLERGVAWTTDADRVRNQRPVGVGVSGARERTKRL
jgi:hypothetical protein